jgi:hypothetical protein
MVTRDQRQNISNLAALAFNAERAHDIVRICSAKLSALRVDADGIHFVRLSYIGGSAMVSSEGGGKH